LANTLKNNSYQGYAFLFLIGHSSPCRFFSPKSPMDHTCKLHSKCLREDESLEICEVVETPEGRTIARWYC